MNREPGVDEWADKPRPHGSLVIGGVAGAKVATILCIVVRRTGCDPSQSEPSQEPRGDVIENRFPADSIENGMRQRDREDLIRPAGIVVALLAVNDVVEVPKIGIPEPGVEGIRGATGVGGDFIGPTVPFSAEP